MSRLATEILRACTELGLEVELEYTLTLYDTSRLWAVARIAGLGAPKGMLVLSSYDEISAHVDSLRNAGFGFSVLDEPHPREPYDLGSYMALFRDWGWAGPTDRTPDWLR